MKNLSRDEFQCIWKFDLVPLDDLVTVPLPDGAVILDVQMQRAKLCLWARVNPNCEVVPRTFAIYGTGRPMFDVEQEHVATIQDGAFVWHIFELDV